MNFVFGLGLQVRARIEIYASGRDTFRELSPHRVVLHLGASARRMSSRKEKKKTRKARRDAAPKGSAKGSAKGKAKAGRDKTAKTKTMDWTSLAKTEAERAGFKVAPLSHSDRSHAGCPGARVGGLPRTTALRGRTC